MEVIFGLEKINSESPAVVTVGTFDGIHLGHRKIIDKVLELAQGENLISTLLTFEPHPKVVVQNSTHERIKILTNLEEKLSILQGTGIERVVIAKFTREFSEIEHRDFVLDILVHKLLARYIVVGHDHEFGRDRTGNYNKLEKLSEGRAFSVKEVGPYELNGVTVSSTGIRRFLNNGEVLQAAAMLGDHYSLRGIVVKGEGRGKKLSFPTANISVDNHAKLTPKEGVYVVDCQVRDEKHRGMVNIGYKPTFGGLNKTVEVHLFDFTRDIYGEKVTLYFLHRLREEIKFNNEKELIRQLQKDRELSSKI
jgi:riboflavin kinase/FMN adenylyltransferase